MADELDLSEALRTRPFAIVPMTLEFIGGPKDGRTEDTPSWMLESRQGSHKYHLAIAQSDDPTVPYKYVLVSHSLLELP